MEEANGHGSGTYFSFDSSAKFVPKFVSSSPITQKFSDQYVKIHL